jgi:hypothetical protein
MKSQIIKTLGEMNTKILKTNVNSTSFHAALCFLLLDCTIKNALEAPTAATDK